MIFRWPENVTIQEARGLLGEYILGSGKSAERVLPRYGWIRVQGKSPQVLKSRWLPKMASSLEMNLHQRRRPIGEDSFELWYNRPIRCPGFIAIAYAVAGNGTSIGTLRAGLAIVEEIGILLGYSAIVLHANNSRLDDRVMHYFGYERHALHLRGRHYIRRLNR
jgi:hypothetical protein